MNLTDYGFTPAMMPENESGTPARVISVYRERYELVCEHGPVYGVLKPAVYFHNGAESIPAVGDFVLINYNPYGDSQITKTLERKSFFSRRDPTPGRGEQAVAANFDYVFIMQSLNDDFNIRRLERYVTLAWQSGGIPVVILNKADLAGDCSDKVRAAEKVARNAAVYAISVKTGYGFDALSEYLKPRKTIVLLGSSGVGKSSFVNALAGRDIMAVNEIREADSKGRHTTTHRQLIMLDSGAMVIDTPGMRELGMWDVSKGLGEAFDDVERWLGRCKFSDCRHQTEPGCAVREAIMSGELPRGRWESYLKLKQEARYADDKAGYLQEKKRWEKNISKYHRQMQGNDMRHRHADAGHRHTARADHRDAGMVGRQTACLDYRNTACHESFTCKVCGELVVREGAGTQHRNHCPKCLSSLHVDNEPGDRASLCRGIMDPIGVWVRKNGEWAIIHRCRECGVLSSNRIAADDNPALLMSIAVRPLASPPFPLAQLEQDFSKR
ncbi:MAG TPA: ribosome small subunit-dependent GTPase A [Clostridiales bacterium]|nr:ribosome small subunit-dependent GTPase A [Clostridiales bacterium]HPV02312.1 ribosome small subunit-dependent GTPase A [Clostridiales bacterium]